MWLSDVTITSMRAIAKPTTLVVTVGGRTAAKRTFVGGEVIHSHRLVPTAELVSGAQVSVKLFEQKPLRKILPNVLVEGRFRDPTTSFVHYDGKGHKVTLNVVADPEPLRDLILTSKDFREQLKTVLDRLGSGKQAVETGVTVANAVGEFNHVLKAVAALVSAAHLHLREQEKRDKNVKTLTDRILSIFEQVQDIKEASVPGARLVALISKGETLFRQCVEFTVQYCSTPAAERAFRASFQSKDKDQLEDLQLRMDTFRDEFDRELLVHIVKALPAQSSYSVVTSMLAPAIPPKPIRMLGRDSEATAATSVLLSSSPRILVLGDGGMGKTTLALWAMHDEDVKTRFDSRLFVSCEGVTSLSGLVNKVADVLRIPAAARNTQLYDMVLQALAGQPRLLCLDNFETPWEDTGSRADIEDFLRHLHAARDLALIVTMRGTERPAVGLPWSQDLSPLVPLSLDDAIAMYEDILHKTADADAVVLIDAVACVPLAVTLIAALAQDQSSAELLESWRKRGTEVVETSGADRGSNLGVSISISVESRRMQDNPQAKEVLALIALLPDGLSTTILDRLVQYAKDTNFHKALSTLRHVALIRKEESSDGVSRYQMLPPVRRWSIDNLCAPESLKQALYYTYIGFLCEHGNHRISTNHLAVKPELINGEEVLLEAFRDNFKHANLGAAAVSHSHWSLYTGYVSDVILLKAIAHTKESAKGNCLRQLAHVLYRTMKFDEVEQNLHSALVLHQETGDVSGMAEDLQSLGRLYNAIDRYHDAKSVLDSALGLHQQVQDPSGEADDFYRLGVSFLYTNRFGDAEEALKSALALHEQTRDDMSKGRDLTLLGLLYERSGQLDRAEEPVTSAIQLHKQIHNDIEEANTLLKLAFLRMRLDRLDDAEQVLKSAWERYRLCRSVSGEADAARYMGDLYTRRGRLDEAEQALKLAQQLNHNRPGHGKAITLRLYGVLYTRWNRLEEAEVALTSALEATRQVKNIHAEADVLWCFGELEIRRGALEPAEQHLQSALKVHQEVEDKESIGIDHCVLGQIYTRQDKFDEAEEAIQTALEIHRGTGDRYWERMDLEALAELQARRAELEAARRDGAVVQADSNISQ